MLNLKSTNISLSNFYEENNFKPCLKRTALKRGLALAVWLVDCIIIISINKTFASDPYLHCIFLYISQFGYDSSASKGQRITAMERWAKDNFPQSDQDPGHADAVVLITKR